MQPSVPATTNVRRAVAQPEDGAAFRRLLRRHREVRRWSQERLAAEAELDHSLVSRLESGARQPTRESIGKLANGLNLEPAERDRLLMASGYFPVQPEHAIHDEPALSRVYALLRSPGLSPVARHRLRAALGDLAALGELLARADAPIPTPPPPAPFPLTPAARR